MEQNNRKALILFHHPYGAEASSLLTGTNLTTRRIGSSIDIAEVVD